MDFRECIKQAIDQKSIKIIHEPHNPVLEVTKQMIQWEPESVLIENVNNMRLAANLFSDRSKYAHYLDIPSENFLQKLAEKFKNQKTNITIEDKIYGEAEFEHIDLTKLPILTHYESDGGPYITSGVWIVKDPKLGRNLSYHRMMVINENQGTVRVVENRGMHNAVKNSGGEAEIAICIGASPAVLLAAACSPKDNIDELELASKLAPITLQKCKTVDIEVPADSEIVLEGTFLSKTLPEGPFVDITGTLDEIRQQPVVEITRIAHRKNPIYHALIPGKAEHQILMGMPKELDILEAVSNVCNCIDVRMTTGSCAWLHAVIKIQKQQNDDGRKAIAAAFQAHKSLKHCIVVDEDIDILDLEQVEWAIATRFQAQSDLIVLTDQPSSSLDPSATHSQDQKSCGSKMGLDATIKKWGDARKMFQRVMK